MDREMAEAIVFLAGFSGFIAIGGLILGIFFDLIEEKPWK